mgnify:CR=1 FL=1
MKFNTLSIKSSIVFLVVLLLTGASSCSKKKPGQVGDLGSGVSNSASNGGSPGGTSVTSPASVKSNDTTESSHSYGTAAGPAAKSGASDQAAAPSLSPTSGQNVAMISPPGTPSNANQAPTKHEDVAPVPPPPPNCYQISFKHKELASHKSDEVCSQHKNIIKLKHTQFNKASLCVRVNNTPVKYQIYKKNTDEVIFGSVAGPNSVITATYCLKKNLCHADCKVPKDEFLDAIGGSDDKTALWDSSDTGAAELDAKVKRELAEFNETQGGGKGKAFKDWISDEGAPACENPKQARKEAGSKQSG